MQFLREKQFGFMVIVNYLWAPSFSFSASTDIVINFPRNITNKNNFNRKWNTQHHRWWKPELLSLYFFFVLIVYQWKQKWHSTHERNSQVRNSLSVHAYQHLEKRAETNPTRPPAGLLRGSREQTGQSLRITRQRKGLGWGHSHTHSLTFPSGTLLGSRKTVWRKEAFCTWSEMLACRALSGTQGTESREKSMVTRLVRTESMVSSVSVKKRRTLIECLRTNFSVCHDQPYR